MTGPGLQALSGAIYSFPALAGTNYWDPGGLHNHYLRIPPSNASIAWRCRTAPVKRLAGHTSSSESGEDTPDLRRTGHRVSALPCRAPARDSLQLTHVVAPVAGDRRATTTGHRSGGRRSFTRRNLYAAHRRGGKVGKCLATIRTGFGVDGLEDPLRNDHDAKIVGLQDPVNVVHEYGMQVVRACDELLNVKVVIERAKSRQLRVPPDETPLRIDAPVSRDCSKNSAGG